MSIVEKVGNITVITNDNPGVKGEEGKKFPPIPLEETPEEEQSE